VIVDCEGNVFDGLHYNSRWGGFVGGSEEKLDGLLSAAQKTNDGFAIELAVPFVELPIYLCENTPKEGEEICFAMIRTNGNSGEESTAYSPSVPILYGGHNIFGHIRSRLIR